MGRVIWVIGLWIWLSAGPAAAQPNIVLIFSDDAGYNEIGYTGSNAFLTPRIDALAGEGIRFTSAYVTQPVCGPSRAGLLSGVYQQRFGFEENPPRALGRPEGIPAGQATLASRLAALGYTTGAIGKWHLGALGGTNEPADLGFHEFFGMLGGARRYWGAEPDPWAHMRRGGVDVEAVWPTEGDPSLYDPTSGRYVTDAFGEEAVAFINAHAQDPEPFFLYLSFNAPHAPYHAKAADLAMFPNLSGDQRTRAAMTLAMDRAIGWVLDALSANQIEQDTIVVFYNDNGGTADRDNSPFEGYKGLTWEGGIRVPACVRWPGLPQGVSFDEPISTLDLTPTLLAAAGGSAPDSDGVDLTPYLTGQQEGSPHEWLYFRDRWEWAIRGPRWKLVRPDSSSQLVHLFDLDADPGETTDRRAEFPEIVDAMEREYTLWEAAVDKLRWTESGSFTMNNFDHFRSRLPTSNFKWSNSQAWFREDSTEVVTLKQQDSYANAVLEFSTRSSSYIAQNALPRMTGLTFMLHEFRFTDTGIDPPFMGTLTGQPVVMVPDLSGQPPRILVAAEAGAFAFRVETPVEFVGRLEMAGDGSSQLVIAAPVVEYVPGQSVVKGGASSIELRDLLQCSGDIDLLGGGLVLRGTDARLTTLSTVRVGPLGTLGLLDGAQVEGALFELDGRLEVGGVLVVDAPLAAGPQATLALTVAGDDPGVGHDQLLVGASATLAGTLEIEIEDPFQPAIGDEFRLVESAARSGEFDAVVVTPADSGWRAQLLYDQTGVTLRIGCAADIDGSGAVNTMDFLAFLSAWSAGDPLADWNADGTINTIDFAAFLNDWAACRG